MAFGAVVLAYAGFQMSGGDFSDIDSQVIERFKQEVKLSAEPTVTFSKVAPAPYTKADLFADVDALIYGYEDGSSDFNHLALNQVKKYFDELSLQEQKKYLPYILKPTDPESFFNAANWVSKPMSFMDKVWNFAPVAFATGHSDVDYFEDDLSGYLYIENGPIKVFYPADDMIPDGAGVDEAYLRGRSFSVLFGAMIAYSKFQHLLNVSPSPVEMYLVQNIDGANGMEVACDQIYINHASEDIYATAMHELFHCFQDEVGVTGESGWSAFLANIFGSTRAWMIEGGATFAEHIGDGAHNSEYEWYPRYSANPQKSLFTRSYAATLFWYEIYETLGENKMANLMFAYAGNFDNVQQSALLYDDFHQIALNVSGNDDLYGSGAAEKPYDHGEVPLDPFYISESVTEPDTPVSLPLDLDTMSMRYYDLDLSGSEIDYLYFDFGAQLNTEGDDIEVSAFVYGNYDEYAKVDIKEDDEGNKYFVLCGTDNKVCADMGAPVYEGMYSVFLVISNRSGNRSYGGNFTAILFAPNTYKAYEVVMNEGELTVSAIGSLKLKVDFDKAEMKMTANRFWLKFSNEFYNWDSRVVPESPNVSNVEIHPTRLTKYVNNFCSFRGFVEYDFELMSEEAEGPWVKRKFKIEKTDQGDFHITDHKFVCRMDPWMIQKLGVNGPALIVLQTMFAKINTADYGPDSFAGQLHRIFKEFMTLGLKDEDEGEVTMYFMQSDGFETVKIEFNDKLHLYLFKAE